MGAPWDKFTYDPVVTFAFEQLTLSSAVSCCTGSVFLNAKRAVIDVETNNVRYRLDGTSPTSTVGALLGVGDQMVVWGEDIHSIQFLAVSSNATLDIHYAR
jgi:hypothetical protein